MEGERERERERGGEIQKYDLSQSYMAGPCPTHNASLNQKMSPRLLCPWQTQFSLIL